MSTRVAKRNGVVILKPNGKLIGNAVNELSQTIYGELPENVDNPKLLIDFDDVSLMDSSGLGMLMGVHLDMQKRGGRVGVCHVGSNIKSLIVRSKLIGTFEHFNGEHQAVTGLTAQGT